MRIRVKLFATLSRFSKSEYSGAPFEIEIPEGTTIQDLINLLKIPAEEAKITFVNGITQPPDYLIKPDDEVGIFPPIGGG
ncbi:MAG: MoaD/ThiS family protein [Chloroflexi bacterium]|nr:MoaD/ThiS family protein [Chloroflexota bacterium]